MAREENEVLAAYELELAADDGPPPGPDAGPLLRSLDLLDLALRRIRAARA